MSAIDLRPRQPAEMHDPWSLRGRLRRHRSEFVRWGVERAAQVLRGGIRVYEPPVIGYSAELATPVKGRALLCYLTPPFYAEPGELATRAWHSNAEQALEIARACNRLGYVVDVADWHDDGFVPTEDYALLFGIGPNFERLSNCLHPATVRIHYATGAYWEHELAAESSRLVALRDRRGVTLDLPTRTRPNRWIEDADAVVVMGNEFVAAKYRNKNAHVYSIDNSVLMLDQPDFSRLDFAQTGRHFLWFGSAGLLHKGLDVALEAFSDLPDRHLWVCGPIDSDIFGTQFRRSDNDLVRAYRRELFDAPNIHTIGWVPLRSHLFLNLTELCGSLVFPSCAEGMSGGVLSCMARGLVPIVSRESGVDTEDFGMTLESSEVGEIRSAVQQIAGLQPETRRAMAQKAWIQTQERYSIHTFGRNIERLFNGIVSPTHGIACPA